MGYLDAMRLPSHVTTMLLAEMNLRDAERKEAARK